MKLLNGLIFFNVIVSGTKKFCDISELTIPMNAEKWNCAGATGNLVEAGNKCTLKCDDGYSPTMCKLTFIFSCDKQCLDTRRFEHACKANGWRKPDQVDVQCKRNGQLRLGWFMGFEIFSREYRLSSRCTYGIMRKFSLLRKIAVIGHESPQLRDLFELIL